MVGPRIINQRVIGHAKDVPLSIFSQLLLKALL
ncbi:Uncharacterised protein [Vibrio cholerae]|nr:Uncharacterised protein [Vibrio cholerae]CSI88216.1 Uncharacterised protein [Vibrio cholerae]